MCVCVCVSEYFPELIILFFFSLFIFDFLILFINHNTTTLLPKIPSPGRVGTRVYAPYRGCEMEVRHLKPMFDLGQLGLMPFSPRDHESVTSSLSQSDVNINMQTSKLISN